MVGDGRVFCPIYHFDSFVSDLLINTLHFVGSPFSPSESGADAIPRWERAVVVITRPFDEIPGEISGRCAAVRQGVPHAGDVCGEPGRIRAASRPIDVGIA